MHTRCTNPRRNKWDRYGGRGITVCDRWKSFENFLADMGERSDGLTLERIDNDGHYEPGNCKWATRREQAMNKATTRRWECDGVVGTITEWAERLGINRSTARIRMRKWGTFERGKMWVQSKT
jgi:hypothetical protein